MYLDIIKSESANIVASRRSGAKCAQNIMDVLGVLQYRQRTVSKMLIAIFEGVHGQISAMKQGRAFLWQCPLCGLDRMD